MNADTVLALLVRANAVASVAIVLVLVLRPWVRRRLGARSAYWLWLVVPVAVAGAFAPAPARVVPVASYAQVVAAEHAAGTVEIAPPILGDGGARNATSAPTAAPVLADGLLVLWLLGAAALLARSIASTRRLAADASIGPALVGVLRPKLVLPPDFEARFDAEERSLILLHEALHRASGDTAINALVELGRCLCWFNPLAHLAVTRFREDQELACDATVVAARPTARRVYAEALLKAQTASAFVPLGCAWTSIAGKRLGERIAMLGRPAPGRRGKLAGASAVALVGAALGYAAWAQQPERVVVEPAARPEPRWTPTAEAPPGALSHALEGQRHDLFIEIAQKGDIDLVFFGTTSTEMWWWDRRGRSVWDRELAPLKAANFGAQGTHPDSLVWRMQNGELDGYRARLIVINVFGTPDQALPAHSRFSSWAEGYAAVLEEIRARQPQAKILLLAPFPRGGTVEQWRPIAAANAASFAPLVDDETVFYADFGERFFRPDGSFDRHLWHGPAGVGAQVPLFELWAEELQPWLDRFVR